MKRVTEYEKRLRYLFVGMLPVSLIGVALTLNADGAELPWYSYIFAGMWTVGLIGIAVCSMIRLYDWMRSEENARRTLETLRRYRVLFAGAVFLGGLGQAAARYLPSGSGWKPALGELSDWVFFAGGAGVIVWLVAGWMAKRLHEHM